MERIRQLPCRRMATSAGQLNDQTHDLQTAHILCRSEPCSRIKRYLCASHSRVWPVPKSSQLKADRHFSTSEAMVTATRRTESWITLHRSTATHRLAIHRAGAWWI